MTDAEQDSKELRSAKRQLLFDRIHDHLQLPFPVGPAPADGEPQVKDSVTRSFIKRAADSTYKDLVRKKIAIDKRRPDGRSAEEIRPIECEVGVSPRTHGSGLFTRGQTQILSLLTLGTVKEGQKIDDLSREQTRRFMHHYNFPPYSVGETGFMRGPKRRDIGHGALGQRSLEPILPSIEEFPYTIRIVSETLESNGSSSMGAVCGSTLAMMDAGVPIAAPVAGIAMGLVKEGDDYVILTDIQGAEDHLGDMDFKVAGTKDGINGLQMDIKITGVTQEIMRSALEQAKQARVSILEQMLAVLPESRTALADHAPRISSVKIDPEKIGMVIGKGGETIRALEADYDVQIDIEEDGTILIYATEGTKAEAAISAVTALTKSPEVGDSYTGKVVKTTQFGAFVELKKGTDGLLHVSNVGPGRVAHIEDVMARGDVVDVVVQEVDKERGRIGLKLVAKHENGGLVMPEELIERAKDAPPREEREERPRGAAATAAARASASGARTGRPGSGFSQTPVCRLPSADAQARAERALDRRARHLRARSRRPLGRARVLGRRRVEGRARRTRRGLPLHRAPPLQGLVAVLGAGDRRDLRRARRRAERRDLPRDDSRLRPCPRRPPGDGARRHGGHGLPAVLRRARLGARGRARGDRDGRGHPARPRPRHRRRGRLRRPPAGETRDRPRRGHFDRVPASADRVSPPCVPRRATRARRGGQRASCAPPRAARAPSRR